MTNDTNERIDIIQKGIVAAGTFSAGFVSSSIFNFSNGEALAISLMATSTFIAIDEVWKRKDQIIQALNNQFERGSGAFFGYTGFNRPRMPKQQRKPASPEEAIRRLDSAIADSLRQNSVQFSTRRVIVAPKHITVQFSLLEMDTKTINRASASIKTIQMKTGLRRVRAFVDGRYFSVEVLNPYPRIVYGSELKSSGFTVPIGITSKNKAQTIDFTNPTTPHLGLPGPTGVGKSQTARNIAYHLIRQNSHSNVRIIVVGQKYEDWKPFEVFPQFAGFVSEPSEIIACLSWAAELTRTRSTGGKIENNPRIFILLDDTIALFNVTERLIQPALEYISSQGRAPGVHLIFGTQDWTNAGIGSGVIKANVKARMLFGAVSAGKAANNAGRGGTGVHYLEGKGDNMYICDADEITLAGAMVTDAQIRDLCVQKYGNPTPRPWRPWNNDSEEEQPVKPQSRKATPKPRQWEEEEEEVAVSAHSDDGYEKLPNKQPGRMAQAYLRELYAEIGSKREVLRAAWGGVVNESGRTPKTQRWLDEALGEV